MKRLFSMLALVIATAVAAPAAGQRLPLSVEGRVGLALPTSDFGRSLGLGYVLGANAIFNVAPNIGIYAGYSYITFDYDDDD
ncbi:MAG: hypothetical protein M3483_06485, partial [Gemmatimonadota bacterium]|nr:hypothetical protein [Gemmatimonadota bacterium]